VKNNLQIVISLLNSQSAYLNNEDALSAIRNSQHRMHAMSLIHQKLYQSDNLASIDMRWYICELVGYMQASFDTAQRIRFATETIPLQLDVAQAVPLGLILNEAISNAIKYAFPGKRKGQITIGLKTLLDGNFQLSITDDGVGLPDNFNLQESQSLGMSLMRGLAEQLDGVLTIVARDGLSIHITFSKREEIQTTETTQTRA
jgi:two-component sensor histidine kinase